MDYVIMHPDGMMGRIMESMSGTTHQIAYDGNIFKCIKIELDRWK